MEVPGNPPNTGAALSLVAVPDAAATVPGGSEDRLSRLPDDLLVCILLKVDTKQAAKMSALSRRWRGMWAQLRSLQFDGVDSSVIARALAAYQAHGERDIHSFTVSSEQMDAQQTTAWMSLVAPLLSGRLDFDNRHTVSRLTLLLFLEDAEEAVVRGDAFELPCFMKATKISMDLGFLGLALPPAGVFDALRVMCLKHFWFRGQLSITDTMFPSLQKLFIRRVRGLVGLTLESEFLLDVHLSGLREFQELNILAPRLEELEVTSCFYAVPEPVASIAAERLKVLRWKVPCFPDPVCREKMQPLLVLGAPPITTLCPEDICAKFLNCFLALAVNHLELQISSDLWMDESLPLMKYITIPYVNVLWLYLETYGHVFEGRVMQLLTNCSGIRELNLSFEDRDTVPNLCLTDCTCHKEPEKWQDEVVPIRALERVKIVNFHGAPREVYFVEQLVLRAPRLKLLRVTSKVEDHSLDGIRRLCPADCKFNIVPDTRSKEE